MAETLFETTDLYVKNAASEYEYTVNQGGSSSGKTYAILQVLFTKAITEPGVTIFVVGANIPALKIGAMKDAKHIVEGDGINPGSEIIQRSLKQITRGEYFNKSDFVYTFNNGATIQFKSPGDAGNAKNGKREYTFFNEANNIPWTVFLQISMRTTKQVYIDYNPDSEFWVHENLKGKPNVLMIYSDYRHNPFVLPKVKRDLEALKDQDIDLWKVYARGITGKIEGLIYRNYNIVQAIPVEAKRIGVGLDFGFTNDVTAAVDLYLYNGELYAREIIYDTGLLNRDIITELGNESIPRSLRIVADSAAPKDIHEILNGGYNCYKCYDKEILSGVNLLKKFKLNVTDDSYGLKKELKNYKWKTNRITGKALNEPVDFMNHSLDALRYIVMDAFGPQAAQGGYKNKIH